MVSHRFADDATVLAERALLGSLIDSPRDTYEVCSWLRASDFTDPWHGAVYTVVREQAVAHATITPESVATGLSERLGPRRANPAGLVDLLHARPDNPDPIGYGQMVTETGLRREIAGQGVLLRAGALHAALTHTGRPATAACDLVDAAASSAERRWHQALTGDARPEPPYPAPLRAAARSTEVRLGADKLLALHQSRDPATEHDHEIALIGALIAHPDQIPTVAAWLPPTRITEPAWRTVYACALDLLEREQFVDEVSVAWATRGPAHHGAPVPDVTALTGAVSAARFMPAGTAARLVAGDQLRRLADIGADQLHTAAANPGVQVADLIDTTRLLTTSLRHVATALAPPPGTTTQGPAQVRQLHSTRGPVAG
ncbi:MAG: hypothetical protein KQH57_20470 [Actinomycetales bacterium]|nr:hypothetical protein [Actinomycetales bacterium]